MDVVEHCLSLVPLPYLSTAFSFFKIIWSSVERVQISKRQLQVLASSIGELLNVLDFQYRASRISEPDTLQPLANMNQWVIPKTNDNLPDLSVSQTTP